MTTNDLELKSIDELWALHEKIAAKLVAKLSAEKSMLENRLRQLNRRSPTQHHRKKTGRRPYPTVFPKFRNPERPSETWAGRGKRPRWLTAQLKSGKRIDDFRIKRAAA
jgi:DNA-binding protein H-NS